MFDLPCEQQDFERHGDLVAGLVPLAEVAHVVASCRQNDRGAAAQVELHNPVAEDTLFLSASEVAQQPVSGRNAAVVDVLPRLVSEVRVVDLDVVPGRDQAVQVAHHAVVAAEVEPGHPEQGGFRVCPEGAILAGLPHLDPALELARNHAADEDRLGQVELVLLTGHGFLLIGSRWPKPCGAVVSEREVTREPVHEQIIQ